MNFLIHEFFHLLKIYLVSLISISLPFHPLFSYPTLLLSCPTSLLYTMYFIRSHTAPWRKEEIPLYLLPVEVPYPKILI